MPCRTSDIFYIYSVISSMCYVNICFILWAHNEQNSIFIITDLQLKGCFCHVKVVSVFQEVNMEAAVTTPQMLPVNSRVEKYAVCSLHQHVLYLISKPWFLTFLSLSRSKHVLEAFEALRGNFHQIQTLTRRQKDHLKRFYRGNDMTNGNVIFKNKIDPLLRLRWKSLISQSSARLRPNLITK